MNKQTMDQYIFVREHPTLFIKVSQDIIVGLNDAILDHPTAYNYNELLRNYIYVEYTDRVLTLRNGFLWTPFRITVDHIIYDEQIRDLKRPFVMDADDLEEGLATIIQTFRMLRRELNRKTIHDYDLFTVW
jgi:hypothetical protein